ncbi:hypothetical protein LOTGIDRAFT_176543, partial [Lottia gigantea]
TIRSITIDLEGELNKTKLEHFLQDLLWEKKINNKENKPTEILRLKVVLTLGFTVQGVLTLGFTLQGVLTLGITLQVVLTLGFTVQGVLTLGFTLQGGILTGGFTLRFVFLLSFILQGVLTLGFISEGVLSVGFTLLGVLLLGFTLQGVLTLENEDICYIVQAVNELYDFQTTSWRDNPKINRFVFIGRNLEKSVLENHLYQCKVKS